MEAENPIVDETFLRVFREATEAMDRAGVPFLMAGGIASMLVGRPRFTRDIDFFVKPDDARRTLEVLRDAGFETEETDPSWLYKAVKEEILIDVIFRSTGDIYVDDEMLARAIHKEWNGVELRLIPREDLLVIKASAHSERAPRHWWDGLAILAKGELDWEYLVRRAHQRAARVLSLLVYAKSDYIEVPESAISALHKVMEEQGGEQLANQTLIAQLREALAGDPSCGELNIHIAMAGREVLLTGAVATQERREAAADVARRVLPDYVVIDRIDVVSPSEEAEPEKV